MHTLTNNEDHDEMSHNVAFYQSKRYIVCNKNLRQKYTIV